jgi:hypothetical protein
VYVQNIRHYEFAISGTLISKKSIRLNMARNAWLETECKLYKIGKKLLLEEGGNKVDRKKSLNNEDRKYIIRQFLAGEISYYSIRDKKLIKGINGKCYTFDQVENYTNITVSPNTSSQIGENIMKDRVAFCFCPNGLSWFNANSVDEFIENIKTLVLLNQKQGNPDHIGPKWFIGRVKGVDFSEYIERYNGDYMIVSKDDQTKQEKVAISTFVNRFVSPINRAVGRANNSLLGYREIVLGESQVAEAWTDEKSYIAIDRKVLTKNLNRGVEGANYIIKLLVHEYCHTEPSCEEHGHGEEFMSRFHEAIFDLESVLLATKISKSYFDRCQKAGLPFKRLLAGSIDSVNRNLDDEMPVE